MAATVQGIHLIGDHASRPAAADPPISGLYSCTDHSLIYITDGASWTTYADLTGTPIDFGESGDMVASAPGDTVSAGASGEVSDAAHRHAREAYGAGGDIAAEAIGSTVLAGAVGKVADAGHRHAMPSAATITAALDWGETGDIVTQAFSDAAAAGVLDEVARADHKHGMPSSVAAVLDFGESGDIVASAPGDTVAAGATAEVADAGHRHAREAWGAGGDIGASAQADAAAAGASGKVADAGHKHPRLTERVVYEFIMDGAGATLATGLKGFLYIPDAFTITGVVMGADQSGSAVVDLWVDSYANYPPTVADTITAAAKPTITATTKSKDTTLTGWTTSVAADRWLGFNLDSVTSVQRLTIAVFGYRA